MNDFTTIRKTVADVSHWLFFIIIGILALTLIFSIIFCIKNRTWKYLKLFGLIMIAVVFFQYIFKPMIINSSITDGGNVGGSFGIATLLMAGCFAYAVSYSNIVENKKTQSDNKKKMHCGDCPVGKIEQVVGNGINEPPYIWLVRCPYSPKCYKNKEDECSHEQERKDGLHDSEKNEIH